MCGIVGIMSHEGVAQDLFDALTVLQHRGQDAAGIMTLDDGYFHLRKANGLVRDVFLLRHMERLKGHCGIGHVRYPTAGSSSEEEAQPFFVNAPFGIALAHNGNLTNAAELKETMLQQDRRHINTHSDSEILLNVFAHALGDAKSPTADVVFRAATQTMTTLKGGYATVSMIAGGGLLGMRDPFGIRPLVYGVKKTSKGNVYMIASETVALDTLGYEFISDVAPGEAIYIDFKGELHRKQCLPGSRHPCAFEFVYLARPDSIIDGVPVHWARLNMGTYLAKHIMNTWPEHDIDVVIPVPDTARSAAQALATAMNVPMREGFVKNRYIGRTFIMPSQATRSKSVRKKLNAMSMEFKDKNVLLVDDSIVRGTTCKQIIQMARDCGAKKVYFASAAPAVRHPNVYGIDMPIRTELVAFGKTDDEVAEYIGCDKLIYQTLDNLKAAIDDAASAPLGLETSVFDGTYVTGDVTSEYIDKLEAARHQAKKNGPTSVIDLSNAVI
ncbi:MAG: amidophosphoribosyltransferase [Gammaproteobacteria bacterium]